MQQRRLLNDAKPTLKKSAVSKRRSKQRMLLWALCGAAVVAVYMHF